MNTRLTLFFLIVHFFNGLTTRRQDKRHKTRDRTTDKTGLHAPSVLQITDQNRVVTMQSLLTLTLNSHPLLATAGTGSPVKGRRRKRKRKRASRRRRRNRRRERKARSCLVLFSLVLVLILSWSLYLSWFWPCLVLVFALSGLVPSFLLVSCLVLFCLV